MKEVFDLPVLRYRSKDNDITCAANFKTGEVCQFYMTSNFGTKELCFFDEDNRLFRRDHVTGKGHGSLIPCKKCPLWKGVGR